ncbi:ABC transporter substrate-binding protein [Rhizobium sp. PP-CC-3G-465]|uniref:ABC transporter substrate-binding protein n=1 Tax=Rhizobium sp. PP-CC-3G-465 TaxID=2135648 RepID=UPI00104A8338|nr:iron complex transport system substrate-binding protein [Rhizobium sp. PP-CC-3G-465]
MRITRRDILGAALAAPTVMLSRHSSYAEMNTARMVSLDLLITELLLTLGEIPIAVANIPLYRRLVSSPILPQGVMDLGPLNEPNLEYLQQLAPGRVLVADWQAPNLQSLARIAPLMPIKVFAGKAPALTHCETLLSDLGKLTGRGARAVEAIAATHEAIRTARSRLRTFSRAIYICRFSRDGRNIALFGGNGMLGDVAGRTGLRNAFSGRVNAAGVTNAPLSRLADEPDAVIVHFDRGEETDVALKRLEASALWLALPAVQKGHVIRMPVIYPSGGLRSAERFADQLGVQLAALADG